MPNSRTISLTAADGNSCAAYLAEPEGTPRGALVIVQEVFGVNYHVRAVADDYANRGYVAISPSLFDRAQQGVEMGYSDDELARGRELRQAIGWDGPVADVKAAMEAVSRHGKVGVIGYCWGGSVAFLAATRLDPACAVCYYGGQIAQFKDETPNCPVMMHFGERDHIISEEDRKAILAARPEAEAHVYPAGHGFNCTERADYAPESAKLALERTLAFLEKHVG
ncbi:MAG TPA: dienelactone hydrolase family protein [Pseudohaliea sp.]|nr:dienelactone hydrolase family protein [Pseudohaliea sp.]